MSNIEQLHLQACEQNRDTYIDPSSGYQVLTSKALLKQGRCCGNSCRHCPYGRFNVAGVGRPEVPMEKPVLLNWVPKSGELDVLFWSGGKDSFLTLMHLLEEGRNVILLTSFGALTNRVSIQDIHIKDIAKQATFFKTPLCLVPLYPNTDYKESVEQALALIQEQAGLRISRLVFGDLHLQDILSWRLQVWEAYRVEAPLFNVPYTELLPRLWQYIEKLGLSIKLSTQVTMGDVVLPVGTPYDPELVEHLSAAGIDQMLENGEGHTIVFPRSI